MDPLYRTYRTCYSVGYDVGGKMLRTSSNSWWGYSDPEKSSEKDDIFFETCFYNYDLQIDHASPFVVDLPSREVNVGLTSNNFSLSHLQRFGR